MLNFDFSDFDYELDTCFFNFSLKKYFIEIWINKICGLIKYY